MVMGNQGRTQFIPEKKIVAEQEWKGETKQETIVIILASNSGGLDGVDVGRQK